MHESTPAPRDARDSAATGAPGAAGRVLGDWLLARTAIVFDLDGTLVDTLPDLTSGLNDVLADLGLGAVPATLVRDSLHGGLESTAEAALAHHRAPRIWLPVLAAAYATRYAQAIVRASVLYDGVAGTLRALRAAGVPLAVCTNKTPPEAKIILRQLGVLDVFETVVGAGTTPHRKPHPAPLLHALKHLGATAADAGFVGDSAVDARCAQAAGVPFVHFEAGYGGLAARRCPAHGRFHSYESLLPRGDAR